MVRKIAFFVSIFAGSIALPLCAQSGLAQSSFPPSQLDLLRSVAAGERGATLPAALPFEHAVIPTTSPACVFGRTACGRREVGFLEAGDCGVDSNNPAVDFYEFFGFEDHTITVDLQSSQFDPFLALLDSEGDILATNDDGGPGLNSRIVFDLPADDTYILAASSFGVGEEGQYTLNLRCAGTTNPGTCNTGPNLLCLSNKRFAVIGAFATAQESDVANVVKLTPDTGYFWFFDQNNVEMVIKVLDTCNVPQFNRFWVFAGGLTNVETVIRVIDSEEGEFRDYINNSQTPFQPIQDTQAFATCP